MVDGLIRNKAAGGNGFSLIEVLVVVGIILVLIGVALPNLTSMNAAMLLDGTARGMGSLVQRAHYDAISDTTGYRVVIYGANSSSNANSYKLQRMVPAAPFSLTAGSNWTDVGDPIPIPRGIDMVTNAPEVSTGVVAVILDSAGDVIDENGAYITSEITITLTNDLGDSNIVYIASTSHVRIV